MAADEGFRIAGAYVEIGLKDSTQADWDKIKADLAAKGAIQVKATLDKPDTKAARAKTQAELDANPLKIKADVDQRTLSGSADRAGRLGGTVLASAVGLGVLAGGPLIGGALVGAGVAGMTALGVVLQKGNPAIQQGWTKLATDAKAGATQAAAAIVPPVSGALAQLDRLIVAQQPRLAGMFAGAGADIAPLANGLVDLADNALPGLDNAMAHSMPIAQGLATVERDIGTAVGDVANAVAGNSGQIGSGLSQVGSIVTTVGHGVSNLIGVASELSQGALPAVNGILGTVSGTLGALKTVLGPVAPEVGALATAGLIAVPVFRSLSTATDGWAEKLTSSKMLGGTNNLITSTTGIAGGLGGLARTIPYVGVAVAGLSALTGALAAAQHKAADAAAIQASDNDLLTKSLKRTQNATEDQINADEIAIAKNDLHKASLKSLADGSATLEQTLNAAGVSQDEFANAVEKGGPALSALRSKLDAYKNSTDKAYGAGKNLTDVQIGAAANADYLGNQLNRLHNDFEQSSGATQLQTDKLANQKNAISAVTQALNTYDANIAKSASTFNSATSGIKGFVDATVTANTTFFQDQQSFAQADAAVASAVEARLRADKGVISAAHGVTEAEQGVASALHSEAQAAAGVVTAEQGVVTARRAVTAAQTTYTQSLQAERAAQAALSAARKQAVIDLENLKRQVIDQGDTEAEAQLRLLDATKAVQAAGLAGKTLASLGPLTSANESQFQLLLAEQEAQHNLNDVMAQGQQLAAQNAAQQKAGVSGAQGVVSATQAVTQAQQQDKQAAQALADSKAAVTKAIQAVKDAQYQEREAHLATENAQFSEREAQDQLTIAKGAARAAVTALQVARDADSRSTDINTAAGAANFTKIEQLFEANLNATGSVDEATKATIAQGKQMHITAGNVKEVIDRVTGLNGNTARFGVVGVPSVDMSQLINAAVRQGLDPKKLGFSSSQIGNARASGSGIFPTHADGGPIGGVGTGRSDSNLILASKGEHMLTADDVKAAGGHGAIFAWRKALHGYANGGPIGGDGASILGANIMLTEVGAMFEAARKSYRQLGVAGLPDLPTKNPPQPMFGAVGDTGSHSAVAAAAQAYARSIMGRYGWGPDQWPPWLKLGNQESGWNPWAVNPSSGAYGIGQSLGHGHPYNLGDYIAQVDWMANYMQGRYHNPATAWAHETAFNWYDEGGYLLKQPGINTTRKPEMVLPPGLTNTLETINTAMQSPAASRASGSGSPVTINNYVTQQPREDGSVLAARVSAETNWALMTSVRG